MKKSYSDPLMFSHIFLTGIVQDPSQGGGFGPDSVKIGSLTSAGDASLTISSGADETAGASGNAADVQIVEPAQASEAAITEESIQSVIDQIMGEETETVPSDESSIAD